VNGESVMLYLPRKRGEVRHRATEPYPKSESLVFLLQHLLRRFVEKGRLTVIRHDGSRHSFGGGADGLDVVVRFHDAKVERELFFNPELASAEAYMDGRLTIENGSVYDLLFLFSVNRRGLGAHPVQQALRKSWRALRRLHQ
jgi:cyclopropane-fatty-acyl-phospholipid synthase